LSSINAVRLLRLRLWHFVEDATCLECYTVLLGK